MKKLHLLNTPILMYLTELPIIALLVLSIRLNNNVTGYVKLYPLIGVLIIAMVFIFIYLFRTVVISMEEIRAVGPFSSKDKAIINKGKTLILTLRESGRLIITLFGNDGERPALDWASREDYVPVDINLFREKVEGRRRSIKKVLRYFGTPAEDISEILLADTFSREYDGFTVTVDTDSEKTDIRIKFNETL